MKLRFFIVAILIPGIAGHMTMRSFRLARENARLREEVGHARHEQAISQQAAADLWQTINRAMEQ